MTDQSTISQLNPILVLADADLLLADQSQGDGTFVTKKITAANVSAKFSADAGAAASGYAAAAASSATDAADSASSASTSASTATTKAAVATTKAGDAASSAAAAAASETNAATSETNAATSETNAAASEAAAAVSEAAAAASAALATVTGANLFGRGPVISILGTPPGSPANGDRYLVAHSGTSGVWVGKEDQVAERVSGAWVYSGAPATGQTVYVTALAVALQFSTTWKAAATNVFATTSSLLSAFPSSVSITDGTAFSTSARTSKGDGGGGLFYYDASDTTTADNGGTIRVDGAGRRFKFTGLDVPATLFGAKFDSSTDDTAALIAAITAVYTRGGGNVILPFGTAMVASVAFNYAASISVNIIGQGHNATFLNKIGTDTNPVLNLSVPTNVLGVYSEYRGFTISGNSKLGPGFRTTNLASARFVDLKIINCDAGFDNQGTLVSVYEQCSGNVCNTGFKARGANSVSPNAITLIGCVFDSNTSWGLDIGDGTDVVLDGCDVESNGTSANTSTGGIVLQNTIGTDTLYGQVTLRGCHLEANYGVTLKALAPTGGRRIALSVDQTSIIAPESGRAMTIGAIEQFSARGGQWVGNTATATIAAGTCTLDSLHVDAIADTSSSRQYRNLVTSTKSVNFGGSNSGEATVSSGTVTVSYPQLTFGDQVMLSRRAKFSGTLGNLSVALTPGTGFVISSDQSTETSYVDWWVVNNS